MPSALRPYGRRGLILTGSRLPAGNCSPAISRRISDAGAGRSAPGASVRRGVLVGSTVITGVRRDLGVAVAVGGTGVAVGVTGVIVGRRVGVSVGGTGDCVLVAVGAGGFVAVAVGSGESVGRRVRVGVGRTRVEVAVAVGGAIVGLGAGVAARESSCVGADVALAASVAAAVAEAVGVAGAGRVRVGAGVALGARVMLDNTRCSGVSVGSAVALGRCVGCSVTVGDTVAEAVGKGEMTVMVGWNTGSASPFGVAVTAPASRRKSSGLSGEARNAAPPITRSARLTPTCRQRGDRRPTFRRFCVANASCIRSRPATRPVIDIDGQRTVRSAYAVCSSGASSPSLCG